MTAKLLASLAVTTRPATRQHRRLDSVWAFREGLGEEFAAVDGPLVDLQTLILGERYTGRR